MFFCVLLNGSANRIVKNDGSCAFVLQRAEKANGMIRVIRYLLHFATWRKLPRLPRTYSSDYDRHAVDATVQTLMKLSHVRCPQDAEILARRHGQTPKQLIEALPARRHHRHIWYRLRWMICRATGTTPYDPIKSHAQQPFGEIGYVNEK